MTLRLEDSWVWDFWTVYDETTARHHVFFLHAPTHLGDPDARHRAARVGHATSTDLRTWTRHRDPLPHPVEGLDDLATWTGSTVRAGGRWWMFTTGLSRRDDGLVQRIGSAWSDDLVEWRRTNLLLEADPAWYQLSVPSWPEQHWRDPWLVQDDRRLWHLYVTARDASGVPGCGVVGHAVSDDLVDWEVRPPLSVPTGVFEQLEVISVVQVQGRWVLLFSCLSGEMVSAAPGAGGVWYVPVEGPGSPVDVARARRLTDERLYVGKVVHHHGDAYLMAFHNTDEDGRFVGGLIDPRPLAWSEDGRTLELVETTTALR